MQQTKNPYRKHLFVCTNQREGEATCCARGGGVAIWEALKRYVKEHGLSGLVRVSQSGCQGLCEQGPNVMVFPDGAWYHHVAAQDIPTIIESHLAAARGGRTTRLGSLAAAPGRPIRAILFDLGNVLLPFDHMRVARALAPHVHRSPEQLYQSFFDSPIQALHDEGKITGREFYERVREMFDLRLTYEEFVPIWNDIFWEDPEITALVGELRKTFRLVGISNTNRLHFDFVAERFLVVQAVPMWIVSHEVGARKPEPAIYRQAIQAAGAAPEDILYVDDRLDLVEAGRALGLHGYPYINAARLRAELCRLGVFKD